MLFMFAIPWKQPFGYKYVAGPLGDLRSQGSQEVSTRECVFLLSLLMPPDVLCIYLNIPFSDSLNDAQSLSVQSRQNGHYVPSL